MLSPILPGSAVELQVEAKRRIGGTRSAIVNCPGFGKEDYLLARLAEAIAPIDIFPVHKELRIEQADAFDRTSAKQKEPPIQNFHRRRRLMIEIRHHQPAERAGFFEQGIESDGPAKVIPDRREPHGRAPYFPGGG